MSIIRAVQAGAIRRRKEQVAKVVLRARAEARPKEAAVKGLERGQIRLQMVGVFASTTTMRKSDADAQIAGSFMCALNASSGIRPISAVDRHRLLIVTFQPPRLKGAERAVLDN